VCSKIYQNIFPTRLLTPMHAQHTILRIKPAFLSMKPRGSKHVGKGKGKAVPLHTWTDIEGSRKLRFPDFVTTAQDGGRLSALRTGHLYLQEILLVLISVRG